MIEKQARRLRAIFIYNADVALTEWLPSSIDVRFKHEPINKHFFCFSFEGQGEDLFCRYSGLLRDGNAFSLVGAHASGGRLLR